MNKLAKILNELMKEQDLTVSELARRTGVGQPVIHRVLSGETDNPKVTTLSPIANFFAISIGQLLGNESISKDRMSGTYRMTTHGWTTIPLLNWEKVINWPNKKESLNIEKYESTEIMVSKEAYALRVKDTTMLPRFPENTLLIVDPALQPNDRDFVIAQIGGQKQALFRQFLLNGDDVYLKPLNADFNMQMLDKKSKILGVMIQARMDFRS